jgi:hypothetical protein
MNGAQLFTKALSCTVEEAKNNAADNALSLLGIQLTIPMDYYNPANIAQSSASLYQGRPLSTAHGVSLNGQAASATSNNNGTNNSNNNNNGASTVANSTNRPQNISMIPDYVPLMPHNMAPYYFDPNGKLDLFKFC